MTALPMTSGVGCTIGQVGAPDPATNSRDGKRMNVVQINQVVALERGKREGVAAQLTKLELNLRNPSRLVGQTRRYERLNEDGVEYPSESTLVQVRVRDQLLDLRQSMVELLDTVATRDRANCDARIDVILEGETEPILRDVPVTHLLFLEKELSNLRKLVASLPTLDPAESWTWDPTTGSERTGETVTLKNQKVMTSLITAPATDRFPAQTHVYTDDRPVGKWYTVRSSGALRVERIRQITDRISLLLEAVKRARERANSGEVTWVREGAVIFDYLLAE